MDLEHRNPDIEERLEHQLGRFSVGLIHVPMMPPLSLYRQTSKSDPS